MALTFHPKSAMVLMCNYQTGFVPPEMVKTRRVIVVSPYQQNKSGLCTIVPISTTPPSIVESYHVCIAAGEYEFLSRHHDSWVKTDMIARVSLERLDRIRVGKQFLSPKISDEHYRKVQQAIRDSLDI